MNKRRWRISLGAVLFVGLCGVVARAVITPNMNLNLPTPGQTYGPFWANQVNQAFEVIDAHDHTPGKGVPVPSAGLNINADVPWNSNNILALLGLNFTVGSPSTIPGTITVSGVDLFFTDENGNQIQLTCSGGVCGTPGSIAGLVSPASASYNAGMGFTWLKNSTTPAAMNFGALVQSLTTSGNTVTTVPSGSQTASYTLTEPTALPPSSGTPYFDMTTSGGLESFAQVDNSTLGYTAGTPPTIGVRAGGIGTTQIAAGAVTYSKLSPLNIQYSKGTSGTNGSTPVIAFFTSSTSLVPVQTYLGANMTVSISDPDNRPIFVSTVYDDTATIPIITPQYGFFSTEGGNAGEGIQAVIAVGGSTNRNIAQVEVSNGIDTGGTTWPENMVQSVYMPPFAGNFTFTLEVASLNGDPISLRAVRLVAYEL